MRESLQPLSGVHLIHCVMSVASDKMPGGYYDPLTGDHKYDVHGSVGDWDVKNKNNDASWSGALNALADAGYDVDAIYRMLSGYVSSKNGQTTERNDMFYQYLLGEISKQNTRDYDYKRYLEQLQYNLPTNELQRLMATGMSRDAAFKMLAGAAGGAGSLVGSGGTGTNASVSAPSGSTEIARTGMAVNAAVAVSDAACNMVNTGMNAAVAYEQANYINAQATMTQNQNQAYEISGQAYNILRQGVQSGAISDDEGHIYDSVQSVNDAMQKLAEAGNIQAKDFLANGGSIKLSQSAPYSSEFLSNLYKSERSGRDYDVQMSDLHRREENLNKIAGLQVMDIAQGIQESQARIDEIAAQEDFINESIELVKQQADYYKKMGLKVDADAMVARAQALLYNQQARMNQWMDTEVEVPTSVGTGKVTGLSLFTQSTLDQHKAAAWAANKLNEQGAWSKEVDLHLMDVDNLIGANLLRHWYNEQEYTAITSMTPSQRSLLGLCSAYDSGHVFQYMDRMIQVGTNKTPIGTIVNPVVQESVLGPARGTFKLPWYKNPLGF